MGRYFAVVLMAALFFGAATLRAAPGTVYVRSLMTRIYDAPDFGSRVIDTVARGTALEVLNPGERWLKVRHVKTDGWVNDLTVSDTPPQKNVSLFEKRGSDLSNRARRRASAVVTAGASRGLVSESRVRGGDAGINWRALEAVESVTIDPDEALAFLESGADGGEK